MKKINALLIVSILTIYTVFAQTKVGDAVLPNSINIKNQNLSLNGAGLREKLWFDLYACGLYLENKEHNAANIVSANAPMAFKLQILSNLVSKKKLIEAFKSGIDKTNNYEDVKRLSAKINVFLNLITGEIETGEVFDIYYQPSKGIVFFRNNEELGVVEGLDFKKLIFNIWLSNNPVDEDLKAKLLSK